MFFTTRAKLFVLFTFASFLAGNVKSDSASGCCVSWYGSEYAKPCSGCTGGYFDTNNFICRPSIHWNDGNVGEGLVESTSGSTDCISFMVSESDCTATGLIYISPSWMNGMGCPANTSDITTASSSAIEPNGLLCLISASLVAFVLV